jgi:hypothetical protein
MFGNPVLADVYRRVQTDGESIPQFFRDFCRQGAMAIDVG